VNSKAKRPHIIHPSWLHDSIAAGKRLNEFPYSLLKKTKENRITNYFPSAKKVKIEKVKQTTRTPLPVIQKKIREKGKNGRSRLIGLKARFDLSAIAQKAQK